MVALTLAIASSALAGWLLYRVNKLENLVEALQARLAGLDRQPSWEDPGARVRALLGSRGWAPQQAERARAESEPSWASAETDNPTDPGLRTLVAR